MLYKRVESLLSIYKQGGEMTEKQYQLTEKGKKLLEKLNSYTSINMQEFAAELLGFESQKGKNERKSKRNKV